VNGRTRSKFTPSRTQIAIGLPIIAAITVAAIYRDVWATDSLTNWIAGFGAYAPIVFMLTRIVGAIILIPGSAMAFVAGAAFGFLPGSVYNLISSTIGAVIAFSLARLIAPGWIRRNLRDESLLNRLIAGVEAEGWRFVAFVRLVPLFPYNVANYALGLTDIKASHYTLATLICMIPGDLVYVYMGYAAREALEGNVRAWQLALIALAALAVLAFIPRLVKYFRNGHAPVQ